VLPKCTVKKTNSMQKLIFPSQGTRHSR